jgi:hypothetical protein
MPVAYAIRGDADRTLYTGRSVAISENRRASSASTVSRAPGRGKWYRRPLK